MKKTLEITQEIIGVCKQSNINTNKVCPTFKVLYTPLNHVSFMNEATFNNMVSIFGNVYVRI